MTTIEPYVRSGAVTDIAVILTAIAEGDLATARQATHELGLLLDMAGWHDQCPAITYHNGQLVERYRPAAQAVQQALTTITERI